MSVIPLWRSSLSVSSARYLIKGILNLKTLYDDRTIDLSCKRALAFEITEYSTVKNICKTGSYNLPIDKNYLDQINKFASIKHISNSIKKDHQKLLEIFDV